MNRRGRRASWQVFVIVSVCLVAASVYALGTGRARLRSVPARPTDRAFFVRVFGELRVITELPPLVVEPRPFVMVPYPAPTYGATLPRLGLALRLTAPAEPPSLEAARPVMARHAPASPVDSTVDAPPASSALPDAPDPARLREVVASLRGRAQRCYESTMVPGRVELLLSVEGESGSVRLARATGAEAISRCIEAAALALRFPTFTRPSISIQQTYSFR